MWPSLACLATHLPSCYKYTLASVINGARTTKLFRVERRDETRMAADIEFSLPDGGETYTRDIVQRCEDLIQAQIWQGLEVPELRAWLNTFDGPLEAYFASCLLDALIYRS